MAVLPIHRRRVEVLELEESLSRRESDIVCTMYRSDILTLPSSILDIVTACVIPLRWVTIVFQPVRLPSLFPTMEA
jgi:hypothetical protein